jgi:thiol-disulfide isomerase/thioredoxin
MLVQSLNNTLVKITMKYIGLLGTLAIFILSSCSSEDLNKLVSITGEIENPSSETVKIYQGDFNEDATLEDGTFTMEFEIEKAGFYNFKHGAEYSSIYLTPGDALLMTLDTDQFDESISYAGKGAEANNYMAAKYLKNEQLTEELSFKDLFSLEEAEFVQEVKRLYNEQSSFLEEYIEANNLDENFQKLQRADLSFDFGDKLLSYAEAHSYFTGDEEVKTSEAIISEIKSLDINDESFLTLQSFKNYLQAFLQSKVDDEAASLSDNDSQHKMLEIIAHEISNYKVKDVVATQTMQKALEFGVGENTASLLKKYKSIVTDKDMLVKIDNTYEKWAKIAPGQPAPAFSYADISGEEVSLDDLSGKAVYVDVWATWCGPCLKEMPELEKLQEEYANDERIVFTSISIDENKEAWEKMVKDKEMKGIQLIADKAWNSELNKDYIINGIPRFILIDAAGNIVDANAPRPSSEEIRPSIEAAINAKKS